MNLPNKLSLLRIALIPIFVALYFLPYKWAVFAAIAVFAIAAFTDFLDGHIARKYNLVTDLGKLLDPIADKVLVTAALFCLVATNPLQYVGAQAVGGVMVCQNEQLALIVTTASAILIIARELLISAMRQIAAAKGVVVHANIFGKIKTFLQDITIPLMVLMSLGGYATNTLTLLNVIGVICYVMLGLTVVATVLSGVIYLVKNKSVFSE